VEAAVALTQAQQLLVVLPSWAVAVVAQLVPQLHLVAHLLPVVLVVRPQLLLVLREPADQLPAVAVAHKVLTAVPLALVALVVLRFGCGNGSSDLCYHRA
jgi:hypothetical protein